VNNDVTSESSKNKKAKSLGVSIISEDEFVKMFGQIKP
jgi:DNA ligase (NAD+)